MAEIPPLITVNDGLALVLGIKTLAAGVAYLTCIVYFIFKHPEEIARNSFARWLGLHRASGWHWVEHVAGGVLFTSLPLWFVLNSLGEPEREIQGAEEALHTSLLFTGLASMLVIFIAKFIIKLIK